MTFNCTCMPQYAHLYSSAIRSRSRSCFCSCSCFCSSLPRLALPRFASLRLSTPRLAASLPAARQLDSPCFALRPALPQLSSLSYSSLYLASSSLAWLQPSQRSPRCIRSPRVQLTSLQRAKIPLQALLDPRRLSNNSHLPVISLISQTLTGSFRPENAEI